MWMTRVSLFLLCAWAAGCGGDVFGGDRQGVGSTGGVGGAPTFEADCSNGPLAAPLTNCGPETLASTGNPEQDCVARINQLRWECQCLPPLQRWTEGEGCASQHAEYDSTRSAHAGFSDGICAAGGWAQNECPGWNSVEHVVSGCLQAMWDEGPGPWGPEHGHYINMTNSDYSMVACGFYDTGSDGVWGVQNFQ